MKFGNNTKAEKSNRRNRGNKMGDTMENNEYKPLAKFSKFAGEKVEHINTRYPSRTKKAIQELALSARVDVSHLIRTWVEKGLEEEKIRQAREREYIKSRYNQLSG